MLIETRGWCQVGCFPWIFSGLVLSLLGGCSRLPVFAEPVGSTGQTRVEIHWRSPMMREHPLVGSIWQVDVEQELSGAEFVAKLQSVDGVLVGEKHDNPDHHQIEQWLLKALKPTTLVMEMLESSMDSELAQLSLEPQSLPLSTLKTRLTWPEPGWSWSDYGPLIQGAVAQGTRLVTGNLSRVERRDIYREGLEPWLSTLPSLVLVDTELRELQLQQVEQGHCGLMPKSQLGPMADIQLARDALMALKLQQSGGGALLVAGAGHVRKGIGVPWHLRRQPDQQQMDFITIGLIEVEADALDWHAHQAQVRQFDYVWFTPKVNDIDHCEVLKKKLAS